MKRNSTKKELKVFLFLNDLRESGRTNMFGAVPYIITKFKSVTTDEARTILSLWMINFNDLGNYAEIEDKNYQPA